MSGPILAQTTGRCNTDPSACTVATYLHQTYCLLASGGLVHVYTAQGYWLQTLEPARQCPLAGDYPVTGTALSTIHGTLAVILGSFLVLYRPHSSDLISSDTTNRWTYHEYHPTDTLSTCVQWADGTTLVLGSVRGVSLWKQEQDVVVEGSGLHKTWETRLAQACTRVAASNRYPRFATLGPCDRLVKVWYPDSEGVRRFHYLSHPAQVTAFSWQVGEVDGLDGNMEDTALLTVCHDGSTRLWTPYSADPGAPYTLAGVLDPTLAFPAAVDLLPGRNWSTTALHHKCPTPSFPFAYPLPYTVGQAAIRRAQATRKAPNLASHCADLTSQLASLSPIDHLYVALLPDGALAFWSLRLADRLPGEIRTATWLGCTRPASDPTHPPRNDLVDAPQFFTAVTGPMTAGCLLRYTDGSAAVHTLCLEWLQPFGELDLREESAPTDGELGRSASFTQVNGGSHTQSADNLRERVTRQPPRPTAVMRSNTVAGHGSCSLGSSHPPFTQTLPRAATFPAKENATMGDPEPHLRLPASTFTDMAYAQPGWLRDLTFGGSEPWPISLIQVVPTDGDRTLEQVFLTVAVEPKAGTDDGDRRSSSASSDISSEPDTRRLQWAVVRLVQVTAGPTIETIDTGHLETCVPTRHVSVSASWLPGARGFTLVVGDHLVFYLDRHHPPQSPADVGGRSSSSSLSVSDPPQFELAWSGSVRSLWADATGLNGDLQLIRRVRYGDEPANTAEACVAVLEFIHAANLQPRTVRVYLNPDKYERHLDDLPGPFGDSAGDEQGDFIRLEGIPIDAGSPELATPGTRVTEAYAPLPLDAAQSPLRLVTYAPSTGQLVFYERATDNAHLTRYMVGSVPRDLLMEQWASAATGLVATVICPIGKPVELCIWDATLAPELAAPDSVIAAASEPQSDHTLAFRLPLSVPATALAWFVTPTGAPVLAYAIGQVVGIVGRQIGSARDWTVLRELDLAARCPGTALRCLAWLPTGDLICSAQHLAFVIAASEIIPATARTLPLYHPRVLTDLVVWNRTSLAEWCLATLAAYLRDPAAHETASLDDDTPALLQPPLPPTSALLGSGLDSTSAGASSDPDPFADFTSLQATPSAMKVATEDGTWDVGANISLKADDADELAAVLPRVTLAGLPGADAVPVAKLAKALIEVRRQDLHLDDMGRRFAVLLPAHWSPESSSVASPSIWLSRCAAWARLSDTQSSLVERVRSLGGGSLSWPTARAAGLFHWLRDGAQAKRLLEEIAKQQYVAHQRDPLACMLFYLALRKKTVMHALWKISHGHREQATMVRFLANDFREPRWRTAANKNAYVLLGKQRFELAAAFFLLADRVRDAAFVCLRNLHDPQLAVAVCRGYEGDDGPVLTALLRDELLPAAQTDRDPWRAVLLHCLLSEPAAGFEVIRRACRTSDDPVNNSSTGGHFTYDPALLSLINGLRQEAQAHRTERLRLGAQASGSPVFDEAAYAAIVPRALATYSNRGQPWVGWAAFHWAHELRTTLDTAQADISSGRWNAASSHATGTADSLTSGTFSFGDWGWNPTPTPAAGYDKQGGQESGMIRTGGAVVATNGRVKKDTDAANGGDLSAQLDRFLATQRLTLGQKLLGTLFQASPLSRTVDPDRLNSVLRDARTVARHCLNPSSEVSEDKGAETHIVQDGLRWWYTLCGADGMAALVQLQTLGLGNGDKNPADIPGNALAYLGLLDTLELSGVRRLQRTLCAPLGGMNDHVGNEHDETHHQLALLAEHYPILFTFGRAAAARPAEATSVVAAVGSLDPARIRLNALGLVLMTDLTVTLIHRARYASALTGLHLYRDTLRLLWGLTPDADPWHVRRQLLTWLQQVDEADSWKHHPELQSLFESSEQSNRRALSGVPDWLVEINQAVGSADDSSTDRHNGGGGGENPAAEIGEANHRYAALPFQTQSLGLALQFIQRILHNLVDDNRAELPEATIVYIHSVVQRELARAERSTIGLPSTPSLRDYMQTTLSNGR